MGKTTTSKRRNVAKASPKGTKRRLHIIEDNPVAHGHATRTVKPAVAGQARTPSAGRPGKPGISARVGSTHVRKNGGARSAAASKKAAGTTQARTRVAKKRENYCWWALPVACLMVIILGIVALLGFNEWMNYQDFLAMRNSVERDTYYEGVRVENYDVSYISLETAKQYWAETIEPAFAERVLTLTQGDKTWTIPVSEIGYESDYQTVLAEAWQSGREGTLEQRFRSVNLVGRDTAVFPVTRKIYDQAQLRARTDEIAALYEADSSDAQVTGFDFATLSFRFAEAAAGSYVDADALYAAAAAVLDAGSGTVAVDVISRSPSVTVADISGQYGLITTAVTNASGSSKNRLTNISLALASINGECVKPGETFSFNEVVGQRTTARGYKSAPAYNSGQVIEEVGGGICQVSTTTFNAVMKADMTIVERSPHSRPVSYIDKGKDAAVSWPGQDMKFKNTSDSPIYVVAYLTSDERVRVEVYGKLLKNGTSITIEAETTGTLKPGSTEYRANSSLASGTQVTVSKARTGYTAVAYRVYWDNSGNEIRRELLCESRYNAAASVVEYGP